MTLYLIDCRKDAIEHISLENFIKKFNKGKIDTDYCHVFDNKQKAENHFEINFKDQD
tara:strand:+ start:1904 stop:2074 length:171 start_codon:yes stop_codon:yes gene_type:complete